MKISIILTTIANLFATNPDLCAEVYTDSAGEPLTDSVGQTLSRYCEWTGPDAPVLDADVCCTIDEADDSASCLLPNADGRCSLGAKAYCEYGSVDASGGVVCYQPFPSACEEGYCAYSPEIGSDAEPDLMCCSTGGACQAINIHQQDQCSENGEIVFCQNGVTNEDGTVTCYDPE